MMDANRINQATRNLLDWLNTWRQTSGAYNGWVVHRFDLKRLKEIHDTPWEQTPIIDGLFNLYQKTNNRAYYDLAKESVLLQIARLDTQTGMFDNAGFEDDRFSSLVHNALADCALLTFAEKCEAEDNAIKQKALEAVKLNFDKYFMGVLYSEKGSAFKFSVVDYYWTKEDRFVANMNSVAIEAMMRYWAITKDEYYRDVALDVLDSVISLFCEDADSIAFGGIGYSNTHPDNFISIYTALALRGICYVYQFNKDERLKKILIASAEHLLKYTQDNYFCHAIVGKMPTPYPYWLAGGGMILKGIDDVARTVGVSFDVDEKLHRILCHQQKCGGVSSFLRYNSTDNHRRKNHPFAKVWEEIAPGPPWNAHLFEYLTRYVGEDFETVKSQNKASFHIGLRYVYFESKRTFFVSALLPLYSCAFVLINKRKNRSIIGFSLRHLYAKIIRKIRKKS